MLVHVCLRAAAGIKGQLLGQRTGMGRLRLLPHIRPTVHIYMPLLSTHALSLWGQAMQASTPGAHFEAAHDAA